MKSSISDKFRKAGRKLTGASGSSIVSELNQILNSLLGKPFKANTGLAIDAHGQKTPVFSTLVHVSNSMDFEIEPIEIPAAAMACVIEISDLMNLQTFRAAYERIVSAKRLKKAAVPKMKGVAQTTVTLGIIFAVNTSVPLETLAEELDRLNQHTPSTHWTDMVVVLSQGIINLWRPIPWRAG